MPHFVRLKPYQPELGFKCRRYTYRDHMFVNDPEPLWYPVDDKDTELIEELKALRQSERGIGASIPLFDVCETRTDAEDIVERERLSVLAQTIGPGILNEARGISESEAKPEPKKPIKLQPVQIGGRLGDAARAGANAVPAKTSPTVRPRRESRG